MAAAAGHELDADALVLAGEIASETDGNPFFVGEVLAQPRRVRAAAVRPGDRAVERRPLGTARACRRACATSSAAVSTGSATRRARR